MATTLTYDFAVLGGDKLRKELTRNEHAIENHNRAITRSVSRISVPGGAGREQARADVARERAAKAAAALQVRQQRDQQRAEARLAADRVRNERRVAAERERALNRDIAARKAYDRVAERRVARDQHAATIATRLRERAVRGHVDRGLGAIAGLGGRAAAAIGLAGTGLAAAGVYGQVEKTKLASQLANQAGRPELKSALLAEAEAVRGFTAQEVLGGMQKFVDLTGDLGAARANIGEIGKVALATSTDIGDLASAAGNAFIPLSDAIKDPTERMKMMQTVIRSMAGMGAVGAVEIKDLASEMAGLAAQATKFEGGPQRAMQMAVMMAQAARQRGGAASAAEAVTAVERFGSDLIAKQAEIGKSKALGGLGVNIWANKGKTQLRSQDAIIQDILAATGGDLSKIGAVFGERSIRAIQGFSPLYSAAERQQKGTGRAAVQAEMDRLMSATLSDESLQARLSSRMRDPDIQLKEAWKGLTTAAGKELLPVLTKLTPELAKLVPIVGSLARTGAAFAKWAIENPFKGLGLILSTVMLKEIGGAAIGKLISNYLTRVFSGRAPVPVGGGGGGRAPAPGGGFFARPGAASMAGAAATGAMIGIPIATAIHAAGTSDFDKYSGDLAGATRAAAEARAKGGTAEDLALLDLSNKIKAAREEYYGGWTGGLWGGFKDLVGIGSGAEFAGADQYLAQHYNQRQWERQQNARYTDAWANVTDTAGGPGSVDTQFERASSASWLGSQQRYIQQVKPGAEKTPAAALEKIASKLDGVLDVNIVSGNAQGAPTTGGVNRGNTPSLPDLGLSGIG